MGKKIESMNEEEILNLFYCSFEKDPTGQSLEIIIEDLMKDGLSQSLLIKKQREACRLFNKNAY